MSRLRSIIIIGNSIEAWLPAAYLRARLPSDEYQITLIEASEDIMSNGDNMSGDILARPSSKSLHHILEISEHDLGSKANARPALCANITNDAGIHINLPFGSYGIDREGAEFQHLWKFSGSQKPLTEFNLALVMHDAGVFLPEPPKGAPGYDYGYILDEQGYVNLLKDKANAQHIISDAIDVIYDNDGINALICDGESITADLYIDARSHSDDEIAWNNNHLKIAGGFDPLDHQSGMRLYRIQMAMERLFKLWPDAEFAPIEIAEYNRLCAAQAEHVRDMNCLLQQDIEGCSDALIRKIKLFESRGRIAAEDYEIYSKAEWIAALSAFGIETQSYDRLAMRMSPEAAAQWIDQLHAAIASVVQQLSDKKTGKR